MQSSFIDNTAGFEARAQDTICINESHLQHKWYHNFKYLIVGVLFGVGFVKAEVISWFRIQEMFRLQSFHMYGEPITFTPKKFNKGQVYGGLLFGLGWALTGACPGPLFAQVGTGATVVAVVLASAVAGTWVYGRFRDSLPH